VDPDQVALGLLALVSFGVSLRFAFDMPPLWGADEVAHAGYAIEVSHGHLPTIWTPVPDDPHRYPELAQELTGRDGIGRQIWVANHPPLYYLLAAPFVALADWLGMSGAGLLALRILNAVAVAGNVALCGMLARELVPRRSGVHLLAAALAGSASSLAIEGSYGYNDGVGAVTNTLTLLLGVRLLRRGPSRGLLAAATVAAVAAAGTRTPNLVAVAACTVMAGAAVLVHIDRPHRLLRAFGAAGLVGGAPALLVGWFYLRNLALYGDLTGLAPLLKLFQRRPGPPVSDTLTDLEFHRRLFESFWVRPALDPDLRYLTDLMLVAAVLGITLIIIDGLRRRATAGGALGVVTTASRSGLVAWLVLSIHGLVIMASLIDFRSDGGYLRQRYAFALLPLLVTVLAVGLLRLAAAMPSQDPDSWNRLMVLLISTVMLLLLFMAYPSSVGWGDRGRRIPASADAALGWPWPQLAVALAAVAAVGFLVVFARFLLDPATRTVPTMRPTGDPAPHSALPPRPPAR
jgi:hypothetical protein